VKLDELALSVNWVHGLVIDDDKVKEQALTAARQFSAWGQLANVPEDQDDMATINGDIVLTSSEWGVIKPLFMLYVERENARTLEASRGMGVDVYGRDANTIEGDIRQYETVDLPRAAFSEEPVSI
jgi:hypothetical protein